MSADVTRGGIGDLIRVCTCTPTMIATGRRCEGCRADDASAPVPGPVERVEVRYRLQVAGKPLLGEWEQISVPGVEQQDDAEIKRRVSAGLSGDVQDGALVAVLLPGDVRRLVGGRHVEWVEVEVRRR